MVGRPERPLTERPIWRIVALRVLSVKLGGACMTSEICVMNRHALVLAADSAVTVTRWERGRKEERYFKGANKIFQLSAHCPIGMMIFDAAELQRVPWEIIAKDFRKHLGHNTCGSIDDYAVEFFTFIEEHRGLFPEDYLKEIFVETVDRAMIRALRATDDDDRVKKAGADAAASDAARIAALSDFGNMLKSLPIKGHFTQAVLDEKLAMHEAKLRLEAELDIKYWGANTTFPPEELVKIGIDALYRNPEAYLESTGIVIAGYGDDEFLPTSREYACAGFLGDKLLIEKKDEFKMSPRETGFINAFGTTAMVDTFTAGFGRDVFASVRSHLDPVLREFAKAIEAETSAISTKLETHIQDAIKKHTDKWADAVFERHARPMRRVIGSLPVDEMAGLAETLVMLESLKEKVTKPSESVGGPIDVAVVTKSEGFIWVKRKHFFDPKLNPRFFMRQRTEYEPFTEKENADGH
jgi:hypothetical protein